ncbi:6344_t:CDS:2 [Gigaspora margarita]|uniref:6344_t:CDS:1 n=1 Tax=Gigaspora margarita TaxID=4874 RepID=A0ABN7V851_GIGMA|nr:6344_t:CDS:2 [Gigaspora margarita]
MLANQKEPIVKSDTLRLSAFLADCLSVGCLKGFKHFEVYLRGREELLLRVYIDGQKQNSEESDRMIYNSLSLAKFQLSNGSDFTEMTSSPSSPLDEDLEKATGYARYKRPYVWLRSNHKRLIQLQDDQKLETDNPLKLDTIAAWKTQDVKLWDIIAEVITLSLSPPPENPFEINHSYYDTLPLEECAVSTVFEDIKILQQRHFAAFEEMNEALNSNALEKSNPSSGVSATN